ncbi:MAG: Flp family type IVb pilin [Dehalococcoidia bacterium]|nr:Flp family type IVb pilin [Dehalococcoidia bacterium]
MRDLMLKAAAWSQARQPREEGQTVIEYALIVAAVSIVLLVALLGFGQDAISWARSKVDAAIT